MALIHLSLEPHTLHHSKTPLQPVSPRLPGPHPPCLPPVAWPLTLVSALLSSFSLSLRSSSSSRMRSSLFLLSPVGGGRESLPSEEVRLKPVALVLACDVPERPDRPGSQQEARTRTGVLVYSAITHQRPWCDGHGCDVVDGPRAGEAVIGGTRQQARARPQGRLQRPRTRRCLGATRCPPEGQLYKPRDELSVGDCEPWRGMRQTDFTLACSLTELRASSSSLRTIARAMDSCSKTEQPHLSAGPDVARLRSYTPQYLSNADLFRDAPLVHDVDVVRKGKVLCLDIGIVL